MTSNTWSLSLFIWNVTPVVDFTDSDGGDELIATAVVFDVWYIMHLCFSPQITVCFKVNQK